MADSILRRIPMVAGPAYAERVGRLPSSLTVTLHPEPDNRYFRHAIAVLANGEKVGYVAPEIARACFEEVKAKGSVSCPARRATHIDHETSGVALLLDFSGIDVLR